MDHDNNKSSMWWMMLPCLAIFILLVFAGSGAGFSSWPFLLILAVTVGACVWMMFRGHGHGADSGNSHDGHKDMADMAPSSSTDVAKDATSADGKKGHSNHSCCH